MFWFLSAFDGPSIFLNCRFVIFLMPAHFCRSLFPWSRKVFFSCDPLDQSYVENRKRDLSQKMSQQTPFSKTTRQNPLTFFFQKIFTRACFSHSTQDAFFLISDSNFDSALSALLSVVRLWKGYVCKI